MKKTNLKRRKPSPKKRRLAPHVRASLLSIAPHKATGHRLPHRHTSHGALLLILILTGIILFIGIATIQANAASISDTVHITAQVNGAAPSQGAVITSPVNKTQTNNNQLQVSGTCPSGTLVAIYNNALSIGSTVCQSNAFNLSVQINQGVNVLQAQDYDSLNQAGPATAQILVEYSPGATAPTQTVAPSITAKPAAQPSAHPCIQGQSVPTAHLSLAVSCVTRNVFVGETIQLPVTISGGIAPYAVTIDWGNATPADLWSFTEPGNYTVNHVYQDAGIKKIIIKTADSTAQSYQLQTVVDINGTTASAAAGATSLLQGIASASATSWVDATVPLYVGLVVLMLGFWAGDVFQRFIAVQKRPSHRRHA